MISQSPQILNQNRNYMNRSIPQTIHQTDSKYSSKTASENTNKRHSMPLKITSESKLSFRRTTSENDQNAYQPTERENLQATKSAKSRMTDSVLYRKPSEITENKRASGQHSSSLRNSEVKAKSIAESVSASGEPKRNSDQLNSSFRQSSLDKYRKIPSGLNGEIKEESDEYENTMKTQSFTGARKSSVSLHRQRKTRSQFKKIFFALALVFALALGGWFALSTIRGFEGKTENLQQQSQSTKPDILADVGGVKSTAESLVREEDSLFDENWANSQEISDSTVIRDTVIEKVEETHQEVPDSIVVENSETFVQKAKDDSSNFQEEESNIIIENDISYQIVNVEIEELQKQLMRRERIRVRDYEEDFASKFSKVLRDKLFPMLREEISKTNIIIYTDPDMQTYYMLVQMDEDKSSESV